MHSLYIVTVLLLSSVASTAQSQAPRRMLPVMVRRDTIERLPLLDSAPARAHNSRFTPSSAGFHATVPLHHRLRTIWRYYWIHRGVGAL
jgi:hypothetical protein